MTKALAEEEFSLKDGSKNTKKLWQFEYRPMDTGELGLIEFTVREENLWLTIS